MQADDFDTVAAAFTQMANRIIYCTLTTVDRRDRPRSRMVHTMWDWDGVTLTGWVGSLITPLKQAHLANNPYVSCTFWQGPEAYDTCTAECRAELLVDEASKRDGWRRFAETPPPLGYEPDAVLPEWAEGPMAPSWGLIKLEPWHLHVVPGEFARSDGQAGRILTWQDRAPTTL